MDGLTPAQVAALEGSFKSRLVGQEPYDREKFWHWFSVANQDENLVSVVDMALWDLQARALGVPIYKMLGACRDKVKAYASTYPNMGTPDDYASHALACKQQGYTHYKIHPYYFWDPVSKTPDPGRPSHVEQDIEVIQAVRAGTPLGTTWCSATIRGALTAPTRKRIAWAVNWNGGTTTGMSIR